MTRIAVILPVFRCPEALVELNRRLAEVLRNLSVSWEIVYVNDASPDDCGMILDQIAAGEKGIRVIHHPENRGQSAALLSGLRHASADYFILMDADLQDPPEAIPRLLEAAQQGYATVFAGRRGAYESRSRLLTSRIFKRVLAFVTGLPADAGLFLILDKQVREHLLSLPVNRPFLLPMIASARLPVNSIPVERRGRQSGFSAYSGRKRLAIALHAFRLAILFRLAPPRNSSGYNRYQRQYFEETTKRTMIPVDTPYLRRQVDQVLEFAALKPQDRVLELGCGMGRYTLLLAGRGTRVEGCDLSPVLLERLREYSGTEHRIPLHCFDVASPPPELEAQFDAVLGMFMLHHVQSLEETFAAVNRLLKPGGKAIFLEPNPRNPLYYVQILITPRMKWKAEKGMLRMRPTPLFAAAAAAGLSEFREKRFGFFPPFLANRKWGAVAERILEAFPLWRPLLPFQLFAMGRGDRS